MNLDIIRSILLEKTNRAGLPTQQEIANFLARYYPEEKSEDKLFGDNWGLFSKNPSGIVQKILLCTTPTDAIMRLAKKQGYDIVISHHDFLFRQQDVPQIIYHSAMDEAKRGHNRYFMNKLGIKNIVEHHKVLLQGNLYKPLTLEEFQQHLIQRGFEINGLVWENPKTADNNIQSVLYCSGMGGMLLGPNHIINALQFPADVYVTGELTSDPSRIPNNPFKYIIELGHTSSEKPLFKWIKNMLRNRWENLQIDLADKEIDIWGSDTYKARMDQQAQYEKEWEERRKNMSKDYDSYYGGGGYGNRYYDDLDDLNDYQHSDITEHPFINDLFTYFNSPEAIVTGDEDVFIDDIVWLITDYENAHTDEQRNEIKQEIIQAVYDYSHELGTSVEEVIDTYFPDNGIPLNEIEQEQQEAEWSVGYNRGGWEDWPSYFLKNGEVVDEDGVPIKDFKGAPYFNNKDEAESWIRQNIKHFRGEILGKY